MRKAIVFDVDTQNDYMKREGALYVPEAEDIIPRVADLMEYAVDFGIPIISTMDTVLPEDANKRRQGPHCIKGTWGWQKIEGTLLEDHVLLPLDWTPPLPDDILDHQQIVVESDEDDPFSNPGLHDIIEMLGKPKCLVFGVATEHRVRTLCMELLRYRLNVSLILNATRPRWEAGGRDAIEELKSRGVEFITSAEVIRVAV